MIASFTCSNNIMKTIIKLPSKQTVKETSQLAGTTLISSIISPAHLTIQVATNLIKATGDAVCDKMAEFEGYVVEKIDGTPREETSALRMEATNAKMLKAAMQADAIRNRVKGVKDSANKVLADSTAKIKDVFTKQEQQLEIQEMVIEFNLQSLRGNRKLVQESDMPKPQKDKLVNALNRAIGKLNRNIDPGTVKAAFESQMAEHLTEQLA